MHHLIFYMLDCLHSTYISVAYTYVNVFIHQSMTNKAFTEYPPFNLDIFGSLMLWNSFTTICNPCATLDERSSNIWGYLIFLTCFFSPSQDGLASLGSSLCYLPPASDTGGSASLFSIRCLFWWVRIWSIEFLKGNRLQSSLGYWWYWPPSCDRFLIRPCFIHPKLQAYWVPPEIGLWIL